jgi:hypothetical protein
MSLISQEELIRLSEIRGGNCISIYLPTHRGSKEIEQDRIHLKNLLDEAEQQLQAIGCSGSDIRTLFDPVKEQILDQPNFWRRQLDGLCLFRCSELFYAYRLPFSFDEQVVVGTHLHIKPLLPLLSGDGQFYLLTVHKDSVRVYQGTEYGISYLEIEDLPEEHADLIDDVDRQRVLQWHTATRVAGGHPRAQGRPAAFHGHGGVEQHDEDEIIRYFRKIDEVLAPALKNEAAPLLLAGEDKSVALYRKANSYPHIIEDEAIKINPSAVRHEFAEEGKVLHARAWEILEPRFEAARRALADDYHMGAGRKSERTSNDIAAVVAAAYFERVHVLFVALNSEQWGTFDPETGEVNLESEPTAENRDLIDLAAVHTLLNRGQVYAVPGEQVPGDGDLAAIYRY